MLQRLKRLMRNQTGATAVEYGLVIGLVVLAVMGAISAVAGTTIDMWKHVADEVTSL